MTLAVETAWNNPAADGLLFAAAIVGLVWWLLRREARRVERDPLHQPHPPTSPPISHVRTRTDLAPSGRPLKVGLDMHATACTDRCLCGLDDIIEERLDTNPWQSVDQARRMAWAELHGEVS